MLTPEDLPAAPQDNGHDLRSDYILMLCGEAGGSCEDYFGSGGGGGSILLDGLAMLDALPQREDFFTVDTIQIGPHPWRRPMAQRTNKGRVMLCVPASGAAYGPNYPARERPVPGCPKGQDLIDSFIDATVLADAVGARCSVHAGEALIFDNYRTLHGRDPFVGGRLMWRVAMWTDERMYQKLPDVCLCGCGQEWGGTDRDPENPPVRRGEGGRYFLPAYDGPWHTREACPSRHNEWLCEETKGPKMPA